MSRWNIYDGDWYEPSDKLMDNLPTSEDYVNVLNEYAPKAWDVAKKAVNPMWWLSRPQQAVFQGAQAGAESFGNELRANPNGGVTGFVGALARSLPAMGKGMVGAFNPNQQDVHGEDLSSGLTGTEWDYPIGNTLNYISDPLTPIMGAVAKPAGTMARTAESLWKTARNAPQRSEWIDKTFGMRKYLEDIPVGLANEAEPLAIRTRDMESAWKNINPAASVRDTTRGRYTPTSKTFTFQPEHQVEAVPHELTHWGVQDVAESGKFAPGQVAQKLVGLTQKNQSYADKLRSIPAYANMSDASIGNEILARAVGTGKAGGVKDEILREIVNRAQAAINPEMYKEATRLPLDVISELMKVLGHSDADRWR